MSDVPATPTPTLSPSPAPREAHGTALPAPTGPTWFDQIGDAEVKGHLQTKGWHSLEPGAAIEQAVKAHRNAEKMLGAPADHLVRLPTRSDDEAGWRAVYQRLGAPQKAEDYDFSGIDFDTPEKTANFQQTVRETAHELNVPKEQAERLARTFHKFVTDAGKAQLAETTAQLQGEQDKLAADWGAAGSDRFRANMFIADKAAEALGVTPEALAKLKDGLGASETAKLFHRIGVRMGEDKYVTGSNPTNNGIMSREQAAARRVELMNDREWTGRYLAGGAPEKREMTALNTLIAGGAL